MGNDIQKNNQIQHNQIQHNQIQHNQIILYNNNIQKNINDFKEKFFRIKIDLLADFENLYSITIPGDDHCFFHSILKAINFEYNKSSNDIKQKKAIELRHYLSLIIQEIDSDNKSVYEKMYDGELAKFGLEEKSMINLIKTLNSNNWVDLTFQEIISDLFNIDIYVIDWFKNKMYFQDNKMEKLYKKRNSIIILYKINHYEEFIL